MRVGHRIIEINGHSMVAMPHERIVHLLATSVGEVRITPYNLLLIELFLKYSVPYPKTRTKIFANTLAYGLWKALYVSVRQSPN